MKLNSFAENLKKFRKHEKLSQTDLAGLLLGFKVRTIRDYEHEKHAPTIDKILTLADFFGVSADELVRGDFLDAHILETRTLRNKAAFKPENNFAKNLKRLRENSGFSLQDIGSFLSLPRSIVQIYENGQHDPPRDTLIKLADFFAVTIDELICGNAEDILEMWGKRKHLFESLPLFERS